MTSATMRCCREGEAQKARLTVWMRAKLLGIVHRDRCNLDMYNTSFHWLVKRVGADILHALGYVGRILHPKGLRDLSAAYLSMLHTQYDVHCSVFINTYQTGAHTSLRRQN